MKKYPLTVEECVLELRNKASNMKYSEVEGLLTWSAEYLKQLLEENNLLREIENVQAEIEKYGRWIRECQHDFWYWQYRKCLEDAENRLSELRMKLKEMRKED